MIQKNEVLEVLEAKFATSFKVDSIKHIRKKGVDIAYCQESENADVTFYATFVPNDAKLIACNYIREKWSAELNKEVKNILSKQETKFITDIHLYSDKAEEVDPKAIPTLAELTKNTEDLEFSMIIYLFKNVEKAEDLSVIHELAEYTHNFSPQKCYIQCAFYDPDFFKDKSLSDYQYGFRTLKKGFFENDFHDHLSKRLVFSFKETSPLPNINDLFEILDHSPNIFGSKVNYF